MERVGRVLPGCSMGVYQHVSIGFGMLAWEMATMSGCDDVVQKFRTATRHLTGW